MTKNSVVLLHGAGLGSWIWNPVIEAMSRPAIALDVPSRNTGVTPNSCAEALTIEIEHRGIESLTLVVHSLSGVLSAPLADRLGNRLKHCVYLSAVVPPHGKSFVDALGFPNRLILRTLFKLNSHGLKPSPSMIKNELCNDLNAFQAELVISRYQPEFPGLYLQPTGTNTIPEARTYVRLTDDKSVPLDIQDSVIARLDSPQIREIQSGHLAMLSKPDVLAKLLDEIAT